MKKKISILITAMFLTILCFSPQASAAYNSLHTGYATYTGSGYSGGALLLDPIPSNMKITALNPTDMNYRGVKAALAGAYLRVEGPKGKRPSMLPICILKERREPLTFHRTLFARSAI